MVRVVPAGIGDLVALLENQSNLTLSRRVYGGLLAQFAASPSFAVIGEGGRVLSVAGIAPVGIAGEIWFGVQADGLGPDLLPVVRLAREVLPEFAPAYPGGLFATVIEGHRPGERLARLIGCVETNERIGAHRKWLFGDRRELHDAKNKGSGQQQGAERAVAGDARLAEIAG